MPVPLDPQLYAAAKKAADQTFAVPSALKSAWLVKRYKGLGGRYAGPRGDGLDRWFKERWVDVTRKSGRSYSPCGRSAQDRRGTYPVCRPSRRVSAKTPRLASELSRKAIRSSARKKQRRPSRRLSFR